MKKRRSLEYSACLGVALSLCATALGDAPEVRARFLEEYRPHAGALEDYYGSAELKYTLTQFGPENTLIEEIQGKYDRGHYLLSTSGKAVKNSSGETYGHYQTPFDGRNPSYYFQLIGKRESGYKVKDLVLAEKGQRPSLCAMTVPFADALLGMTFLEMGEDKGTGFLAWEDRAWRNEPMKVLRVEYIDMHKNPTTAEYFFSPKDGWLCRGLRRWATGDPNPVVEEVYIYEPTQGEPFPALKREEQWVRHGQAPDQDKQTLLTEVTELRRAGPFPDSDFRLSAFGIPEPEGIEPPPPSRLWLWLLLGGAALAGVAVFFAWLRRRFRKTSPSPNRG